MKKNFNIKLYADGADLQTMFEMAEKDFISGLTTNPTLMRKAGVSNYRNFALQALSKIKEKPISFEVFSDDFDEMAAQAREISKWGNNVYVKIPITNSKGEPSNEIIRELSNDGIKLNVTAVLTLEQVKNTLSTINPDSFCYISIFAGRIADTGVDPVPIIEEAISLGSNMPNLEIIWASPRELLNVFQAQEVGCHIITATSDILKKLDLVGKDLARYSLETVQMFRDDALLSGYTI